MSIYALLRSLSAGRSIAVLLLFCTFVGSGPLRAQGPVVASGTFCTQQPGWQSVPVGSSGMWNAANYASGIFTVSGIGSQINGTADSFGFAYERLSGDGSIVARLVGMQGGSLAGVMIRETLNAGSTNATTVNWSARGTTYFDVRATTGGSTTQAGSADGSLPVWLKLVRSGSTFSSFSSPDGVTWTLVGTAQTVNMIANVYVGLAVTGGSTSAPATATFDHVSITSSGNPLPCISSVSSTSGNVGSQVVIIGTGFGNSQGNNQVLLNGTPVTINFWNNTTISATIPSGATTGSLWAHEPGLASSSSDSNSVMFTVSSQPVVWGWMDYDLGSEKFVLTSSAGSGGGSGQEKMIYGNSSYANESFVVNGSGLQVYGSSDSSHYLYQQLSGDGSIVARLVSVQGVSGWWAAAGLMIRETLSSSATSVSLVDSPSPGTFGFQVRATTNGSTNQVGAMSVAPAYWMKLSRSGNNFSAFTSPDGINWAQLGTTQTISMAQNVYVGLCVTSASNSTLATATFDNVSVSANVGSAPLINTISATTGAAGSQVLISGSGFGNAQGNSQVTLNTVPVSINFWSNTLISLTIPSGANSGDLVVSVAPSMNDSNAVWFTVTSQPLPTGWLDRDVGTTNVVGAASYANGTFTVSGSGYQIYSSADAFHFAYQPLAGDGSITARVVSMQGAAGWWAAAGVMIRETMNPGATNVALVESPQPNNFGFEARTTTNGYSSQSGWVSVTPPYWVKLTRSGNNFSGYTSADGATWTQIGSTQTINMAQNVYVGLAVESGSSSSLATATFDNVSVVSSLQSPTVGSLQPSSGSEGDSVIISGSNFGSTQGNNTVSFGGVQATTVGPWSDTQITAVVPTGAATGPVSLVVNGLQSNQNVIFTINITISGISPSSGPVLSSYQISGSGFGASQGQNTVTFNGLSSPVLTWGPTSITALVPTGATTGNVVLTIGGIPTTGPSFTVTTAPSPIIPSITSVSPTSGGAGTPVTIQGSGFGNQTTGSITIGSTLGTVVDWSDTVIHANVSTGSTSGSVQVQQSGYSSNSVPFTVSTATITSVSPNNGIAGTPVTITGSGFGATQGSGIAWLGNTPAVVTSWGDGVILANVGAGSASGTAQVLQNGTWSNSVPFTINTPHIASISTASGSPGTPVTISGNGFGSPQGNGIVWIGNMAGVVSGWSDTSIVASVGANALSGVVKVQQNGAWSNAVSFTVPVTFGQGGTQLTLVPNVISMVVGDSRTIEAVDSSGNAVTGLIWTSSDTTVATLSTDDPPIITAVATGNVTITAGSASADVTVYAGPSLLVGTVIWSNPGDGSGVSSIVPAVPSATGVADVFALQNSGLVQAVTSDGIMAWQVPVANGSTLIPDFQGGLIVADPTNTQSVRKYEGLTGIADPSIPYTGGQVLVHPDGTLFLAAPADQILLFDPITGSQKASLTLPVGAAPPCSGGDGLGGSAAPGRAIIAGDGYLYVPYQYFTECVSTSTELVIYHMGVLRVGTDGSVSDISIGDWITNCATTCGSFSIPFTGTLITTADQGVLYSWQLETIPGVPGGQTTFQNELTSINTDGSASTTGLNIPGQTGPIQPVVQRPDGSYIGTVNTNTASLMMAFTASGQQLWSQPNDTPQIATSDGGVIGSSGITYDQSGNANGQVTNLPTYSWKEAYTGGSSVYAIPVAFPSVAPVFGAFAGGSPTGKGTAVAVHSIGLFWCGGSLSGTCQSPQIFDANNLAEQDLGFTYSPASGLPSVNWSQDFTANTGWTGTILSQAFSALRTAFANVPVMLSPGPSRLGHPAWLGGTPDHIVNIVGDHIAPDPNNDQDGGVTEGSPVLGWNSVVYYSIAMFQAQYASQNLYSPVYPPTTSPQQTAFVQLLSAIGRGIGNIAAHELGHQFQLPDMDCDKTSAYPSCPGPPPSDPAFFYEYWEAVAGPKFLNAGKPLQWDSTDLTRLNQQLFNK